MITRAEIEELKRIMAERTSENWVCFIVAAVNAAPRLIELVERMAATLATLAHEQHCGEYPNCWEHVPPLGPCIACRAQAVLDELEGEKA